MDGVVGKADVRDRAAGLEEVPHLVLRAVVGQVLDENGPRVVRDPVLQRADVRLR